MTMVNKICSVGTKFKAHRQVVFFHKAAATCSSPRCLKGHCFQLYSLSPVHKSTVNVMGKKGNKITSYTSAYTSAGTTGIRPSYPLSRMCKNCAKSFGPSSNEEQTSTKTFH